MLNKWCLKWLVQYVSDTGSAMKRLQFRKENKADLQTLSQPNNTEETYLIQL